MSTSYIPEKIKICLWGKAAGRCQYSGCNQSLWIDSLTQAEFNTAYIAHIIADEPGGPRGDEFLSPKLKQDISNLMLLCDVHHRLVDKQDIEGHPVELLRKMKSNHETRMELITSLEEDKQSHMVFYTANIGQNSPQVDFKRAAQSMLSQDYFPANRQALELGYKNSSAYDHETDYWQMESKNLKRQFDDKVKPKLNFDPIKHFSVFAVGPQPLLMQLGTLISDLHMVDVYQLHREPQGWDWQEHPRDFNFIVKEPEKHGNTVALNLSLSGTIDNSRIYEVLGQDVSIWTLTIDSPNRDFLKSKKQLTAFRQCFRELLNQIKLRHGQNALLNIFPFVPVAIAVESGRVWMPKADLRLQVYDQNFETNGFEKALFIGSEILIGGNIHAANRN